MVNKRMARFVMTDHICRDCQGRIMIQTSAGGPTGGGNPIYRCSGCENGGAMIGPEVLCWCGQRPYGVFRCHPKLKPVPSGWEHVRLPRPTFLRAILVIRKQTKSRG